MFSSHHCRERESLSRDISTQPLLKAQNRFSVMALRTITRFSNLQHDPLSLDCLLLARLYLLEGFVQPPGDFPVSPIPVPPRQQSLYLLAHDLYQPVFRVYHTGVWLFVCLFFTKPTQLGHPPPTFQGPWSISSEALTHPYIFHLCSDPCISPLILPLPHLTSGQIAKGIFDILI